MSEKKYELIPSDIEGFFRVKALKDFSYVKVGDIGGFVSGEHNLSHDDTCWIYHDAQVSGNARVYDSANISNFAQVSGNAIVSGRAIVSGSAQIYSGNIQDTTDYMTIGPIGSRNGYTTFFKDKDKIMVSCGCFRGTIQEFEQKVKETHQNNLQFKDSYLSVCITAKIMIK